MTPRERVMTALRRGQPDQVPWIENEIEEPLQIQIMGGRTDYTPGESERRVLWTDSRLAGRFAASVPTARPVAVAGRARAERGGRWCRRSSRGGTCHGASGIGCDSRYVLHVKKYSYILIFHKSS